MHDDSAFSNLDAVWPALAAREIALGGVIVTVSDALRAARALTASRTSAVAPVLRSVGGPVARCDYFAASAPYVARQKAEPKTGRAGAAGRHLVKNALITAIADLVAAERRADLAAAMAAFGSDERYAVAMARDATALREKARAPDAAAA